MTSPEVMLPTSISYNTSHHLAL